MRKIIILVLLVMLTGCALMLDSSPQGAGYYYAPPHYLHDYGKGRPSATCIQTGDMIVCD